MATVTVIKGNPLEVEYARPDILLVANINASGLHSFGYLSSLLAKYPYANVFTERKKHEKENWATYATRDTPGSIVFRQPPPTSHGATQPPVCLLVSQYGDFAPQPATMEDFKVSHNDPHHQKSLLRDTASNRRVYFSSALYQLYLHLKKTIDSGIDCPIKTVVIPYLAGTTHLKSWNEHYMPLVKSFANTLFQRCGIRVCVVMSRTISYLMKENKDLDVCCSFSDSLSDVHVCDNLNSFYTMVKWEQAEAQEQQQHVESMFISSTKMKREVPSHLPESEQVKPKPSKKKKRDTSLPPATSIPEPMDEDVVDTQFFESVLTI